MSRGSQRSFDVSHAQRHTFVRFAIYAVSLVILAGCSSDTKEPAQDLAASDVTDTNVTDTDVTDTELLQVADETADEVIAPPPVRLGENERCTFIGACQRGLYCFLGNDYCTAFVGCAHYAWADDEGCIIKDSNGGNSTAPECQSDADCATSPYGSNCIRLVCTDQTACESDSDCPTSEFCYNSILCLADGT